MEGLHITVELHGCQGQRAAMTDAAALRGLCLHAVHSADLTAVGELFHPFPAPGGITGVVLLTESHLAVHTWPEHAAVTLDVYVCNFGRDNSAAARQLADGLVSAFAPARVQRREIWRGGSETDSDGGSLAIDAAAPASTA